MAQGVIRGNGDETLARNVVDANIRANPQHYDWLEGGSIRGGDECGSMRSTVLLLHIIALIAIIACLTGSVSQMVSNWISGIIAVVLAAVVVIEIY